jgi:hypothetical protein
MLFTGLPENTWRDFFYESIEEIRDPKKALCKWA